MSELIVPFTLMEIGATDGGEQSLLLDITSGVFVVRNVCASVSGELPNSASVGFNSVGVFQMQCPDPATPYAYSVYNYSTYIVLFGGNTVEVVAPAGGSIEGWIGGYYHTSGG